MEWYLAILLSSAQFCIINLAHFSPFSVRNTLTKSIKTTELKMSLWHVHFELNQSEIYTPNFRWLTWNRNGTNNVSFANDFPKPNYTRLAINLRTVASNPLFLPLQNLNLTRRTSGIFISRRPLVKGRDGAQSRSAIRCFPSTKFEFTICHSHK